MDRRLHPLARHALLERRAFLRAAATATVAGGVAALAGCAGEEDAGGRATATTSLPPIAHRDDLPYWMQGGFEPVHEEVETFDLEVTGALPPELTGLYVRNGSNPSSGTSPHWFLGDGMVHGVALEAGRALWYRNRFVDTPMYRSGKGVFGAGAPGGPNNQGNVSVFHHGGRLLSSGEIGFPYELSGENLSTVGPYDYAGRLTTAMTAHPKQDPETGELHFFGYGFAPPYLTYHVADASGALRHSEEVPVAGPTMMHDFAITDRDVVFWELPVVFDMEAAIRAIEGVEGEFGFRWDPSYGARIGVMPLGGSAATIRWVEIEPCFVFHGVNAHREGERIVLDVCVLPQAFGVDDGDSVPHRWTIGTSGSELRFHDEVLTDRPMDLPAIDRRRTGRANRHAWYLLIESLDGYPVEFAGIGRRDDRTGRFDEYAPGPGERVNEGFVVPAGDGEGEGWLLTYAWDRARGASDLLVLDALDLAAGPVARVHLPVRVPYGFHGTWVPAAV